MSRYDDPRWYEEQYPDSPNSKQSGDENYEHYSWQPDFSHNNLPQRQQDLLLADRAKELFWRRFGQFLALTALVIVAFLGGWFSREFFTNPGASISFTGGNQSKEYSQLFQEAWNKIDQNYVDRDAVDYKKMAYAAITSMVDSLQDNGHTRFMTPEQVKAENQQLSGKFIGIGIYLRQDPETKQLIITGTIPGSPAEKAGFKYGDIILAVDGKSAEGKDVSGVSEMITGDAGTEVSITVKREGSTAPITIRAKRAEIDVPNVTMYYIPESRIAHIQIVQFSRDVSGQLKKAMEEAKQKGATKFILDLRNNPGGFLDEAIKTASLFMKDGTVMLEQDSTGKRTPIAVNGNAINTTDTLVVLVNRNSASAAEIVSGSLQENNRAVVIGEKTFGTGTVLQQFGLSDGSAILIGTQEWLTPSGKFIREEKITPNITVALDPAKIQMSTPSNESTDKLTLQQIIERDPQMAEAIKFLQEH